MAATGAAAGNADTTAQQPAGEMSDMSRLQWGRNRKAIEDILAELIAGTASETKARVFLQTLGLTEATASALIQDAQDGTIDTNLDEVPATEQQPVERAGKWVSTEDGSPLYIEGGEAKTSPGGKEIGSTTKGKSKSHTVKLPPSPSKLKIADTSKALNQMGYKLGAGKTDLKAKTTSYEVTGPDGSKKTMSTDELKKLVYEGAGK
jgi:hypothetical protein